MPTFVAFLNERKQSFGLLLATVNFLARLDCEVRARIFSSLQKLGKVKLSAAKVSLTK